MRAIVAALLLSAVAVCGPAGANPFAPQAAGKTLPPAPPPPALPEEPLVCPADVRQCADGAYVGRNPSLDCAFDACPGNGKQ
jgi:hypothetical protein